MTNLISLFPSPPFFFPCTAECLTIFSVLQNCHSPQLQQFLEQLEIFSNPEKTPPVKPLFQHQLTTEISWYLRWAVSLHALGQSLPLTKTLHVMKTTQSHNTENNWCISPQEHVEGHKVCPTDGKMYIYTEDISDVFNSRAGSNSSSALLIVHEAKWTVPFVTFLWPVLVREWLAQLGG